MTVDQQRRALVIMVFVVAAEVDFAHMLPPGKAGSSPEARCGG